MLIVECFRQIHDQNIFRKPFAERDDFTARVERHAVAVKNQLVVRADGVNLRQRNLFVARHAAQHF